MIYLQSPSPLFKCGNFLSCHKQCMLATSRSLYTTSLPRHVSNTRLRATILIDFSTDKHFIPKLNSLNWVPHATLSQSSALSSTPQQPKGWRSFLNNNVEWAVTRKRLLLAWTAAFLAIGMVTGVNWIVYGRFEKVWYC